MINNLLSLIKKPGVSWMLLSILAASIAFAVLFFSHLPVTVSLGIAIICFVVFAHCFNRGYDLLNEKDDQS